jgi:hypothetical protein
MLKSSSKAALRVSEAKAEQLSAKRIKAENAYLRAIGAKEGKAAIAFAGSGMQAGSDRGTIANVLCASGPGLYDYADIARNGEIGVSALSYSNLAYVANNFAFRADLVGLSVTFDSEAETVRVRTASAEDKADAIRRGAAVTGRSVATVAAVTGFRFAQKADKAARKAAPKADKADAEKAA